MAADYKDWIPCFPDQLGGFKATSKGDGVNMNSDGNAMSMFNKTYGSDTKGISVNVSHVQKKSDQGEDEKPQPSTVMDTEALLMKTVKIQGFVAVYQFMKDEKIATITVILKKNTTVMLATTDGIAKGEEHDIGLFDKIDLKKIYASL